MKKTNVLWIILNSIFLIIFNTLFFILSGTEHVASVWMSYVFIHFSYAMLIITPFLIRKGKSSAVFGFSLYSISAGYFLLQLVTGVVFILIAPKTINTALLVQLCIAGLYGILLVINMIANEHTANAEEKRQYEISFVKKASTKLKRMIDKVDDSNSKKKVEKAYDTVYSSPVKSHPDLAKMENSILQLINELEDAVSEGVNETIVKTADSLLSAVDERNMRLKNLN